MTRILVVEDNADLAYGLQNNLEIEGYEVELAADGPQGLARARAGRPDLMLLDLMLPGTDGFRVLKTLRDEGFAFPVLILTARGEEADKVRGLRLGADDYVTKPFSPRELRARIKARLRRTTGEHGSTFRFGDAEVDFTRAELRRKGRTVDLTPLEFKLLSAFIDNPGRILTRQQLMDLAWGRGTFVMDRAVDQHVVNLRRKIEIKPTEPRHIQSVRGMGYRFDV